MTVVEAITKVLVEKSEIMTAHEIYEEIVKMNLYNFLAMQPINIVNSALRRHCQGINFPSASPIKYFQLAGKKRGKSSYILIDQAIPEIKIPFYKKQDEQPSEMLPEEKMLSAYKEHCENVKTQLLEEILRSNPAFFEKLVLKLLLTMGYGYSIDSGIVTGGPHDKGIDGVIDEDRLGFNKIYIQAKRYAATNEVYTKELKEFVGSMMVDKGVFITTSSFHKNAIKYAEEVERKGIKLKLIDGHQLMELMLRYKVGVAIVDTVNTYIVDPEYFSE